MHMKEYMVDFNELVKDIEPGQKIALLLEGNGSKGDVSNIEPFFKNFKEKYLEFKKSTYYERYIGLKGDNFETIEDFFERTENFLNSGEKEVQEVNIARNKLLEEKTTSLTMKFALNRKRTIALYEAILDKTDDVDLHGGDYRYTPIDNLVSFMYTYKLKKETNIDKELKKEGVFEQFKSRFSSAGHRFVSLGLGFAAKCKELEKDNYDFAYHMVGTRHWSDIENGCALFGMNTYCVFMPVRTNMPTSEDNRKKIAKIFLKYAKKKIGAKNLYVLVKNVRDGKIPVDEIVENL